MYDSVTSAHIPKGAHVVAGYVDGAYRWSYNDWARHGSARQVRIAVLAKTNDGHVLDVETGDATPKQSVDWVLMRRKYKADPSVYCNASTWPAVVAAFEKREVPDPHYWIASWGTGATQIKGAVAHQYADPPASGGHYDLSVVDDYWPGVDPLEVDAVTSGREAARISWGRIRTLFDSDMPGWSAAMAGLVNEVSQVG